MADEQEFLGTEPARRRRGPRVLAAAGWIVLALVAMAYLGYLLIANPTAPQIARSAAPAAATKPSAETTRQAAALARLTDQVTALNAAVEGLRTRNDELEKRFGDFQAALGPPTAALPAVSQASRPAATGAAAQSAPGAAVTVSHSPLPSDGFGDSSLNSVPLPIAAPAPPTRTLFGVELASADKAATLKARWRDLQKQHDGLLQGLEPRAASVGEGLPWNRLRLIAGPFANAADAAGLCAKLKALDVTCAQTVFNGDKL